jgi:hypothetical protein
MQDGDYKPVVIAPIPEKMCRNLSEYDAAFWEKFIGTVIRVKPTIPDPHILPYCTGKKFALHPDDNHKIGIWRIQETILCEHQLSLAD